jgi:hypothetical protein
VSTDIVSFSPWAVRVSCAVWAFVGQCRSQACARNACFAVTASHHIAFLGTRWIMFYLSNGSQLQGIYQ